MIKERDKEMVNALIEEMLFSGKPFLFTVTTDSMVPFLRPYDEITVRRIPLTSLKCGDIVVFKRCSDIYCHRLLRKRVFGSQVRLIT